MDNPCQRVLGMATEEEDIEVAIKNSLKRIETDDTYEFEYKQNDWN